MNTVLTHPPAEDLGRFVEGTMDEAGHAEIIAHVADCDDCRIVIVDATEFTDASRLTPVKTGWRWWMSSVAASLVLVLAASSFLYARRDPLAPVMRASSGLASRPFEARLGGFSYVAHITNRGSTPDSSDPAEYVLASEIGKVLERAGNDARTLHTRGVAHLLSASLERVEPQASEEELKKYAARIAEERSAAVRDLQAAAAAAPDNARYQNDLAAALIEKGGDGNLKLARDACDRALRTDPRSGEALFNRAIALRDLRDPDAPAAFQRYLDVDKTSRWADEARLQLELLK